MEAASSFLGLTAQGWLRWGWPWSQSGDQPQDFMEQSSRHRDLSHLEDDVAAMAHNLGADLHEFFPQARQ
jgi:hypothetical protein